MEQDKGAVGPDDLAQTHESQKAGREKRRRIKKGAAAQKADREKRRRIKGLWAQMT